MKRIAPFLFVLLLTPAARASFADPVPARTYQGARVEPGVDVLLAQMCAGETGVYRAGWFESCSIQVGIVARRAAARGWTIGQMARAYSSAIKSPRAGWLARLNSRGTRPDGFPARASWERYRVRWLRLLWLVRSQLAGDVVAACPTADHFGSVHLDGHRARRAGWIRVCESASPRQGFWMSRRTVRRARAPFALPRVRAVRMVERHAPFATLKHESGKP